MLSVLKRRPCLPADLSILHLERKLKRYEQKTQRPNAKPNDYITRDRLAIQLVEAKTYLC